MYYASFGFNLMHLKLMYYASFGFNFMYHAIINVSYSMHFELKYHTINVFQIMYHAINVFQINVLCNINLKFMYYTINAI